MAKKLAILMPLVFLCLGLYNCGGLKVRDDYFEYRYNVEVVYSDVEEGGGSVTLYYILYDPLKEVGSQDIGYLIMNRIEGNKARCYLPKVFVQHEDDLMKHIVSVVDENGDPRLHTGKNINIQGAYELEIESVPNGTRLTFKML
ncbi:MAG: hypothetical protein ACFFCW_17990 [Candidatus Hodarchaeota archaeon]